MKTAIIIPARYGSSRFPGKPLALIKGKTMLSRVVDIARAAAKDLPDTDVHVTTEDKRIADHASDIGASCIMTDDTCKTGSDRVLAAAKQLKTSPDFIINLQGDAPFTPPSILQDMVKYVQASPQCSVVTPIHALCWHALDTLRENKQSTPFSGTTCIRAQNGQAIWFSKNIVPAIRQEDRTQSNSPIFQHIGLYGYRMDVLEKFCALPEGHYEHLEGLEQLRFLENNIAIDTILVQIPKDGISAGIDSPEDLERANL